MACRLSEQMSASDTESYEVEQIVDFRKRGAIEEFKIKWKNYPDTDNSWETSGTTGSSRKHCRTVR